MTELLSVTSIPLSISSPSPIVEALSESGGRSRSTRLVYYVGFADSTAIAMNEIQFGSIINTANLFILSYIPDGIGHSFFPFRCFYCPASGWVSTFRPSSYNTNTNLFRSPHSGEKCSDCCRLGPGYCSFRCALLLTIPPGFVQHHADTDMCMWQTVQNTRLCAFHVDIESRHLYRSPKHFRFSSRDISGKL